MPLYTSKWEVLDGYHECLMSLHENLTPILRVRAVKNGDGMFIPLVRDFGPPGRMVASAPVNENLDNAKIIAIDKAKAFIRLCMMGE